jgi:ribosomal protein L11 methyltransferase
VPSFWLQLSLRTDPSALDAVSNFLIERGSPGVVIRKNEVQAYFAYSADGASVRKDVQRFLRGIRGIYPEVSERHLRWRVLKERNWNRTWRRFFTPQRIGKMFWVTPPWTKPPSFHRRQVIVIEPGMAFGTGTHATTRGCLEFIEQVGSSFSGKRLTALDVGTGSGILAIALAKLGVKKIIALDNDPVALKVARENICSNRVQEQIVLSRSNLVQLRNSFPLVVANLTAETILELAGDLEKRVAPYGYLILSGILKPRATDVYRYFCSNGFRLIDRKAEKEWVTFLLRRR